MCILPTEAVDAVLDKQEVPGDEPDTAPALGSRKQREVCRNCRGWCCYRFNISMPAKNNKPDWDRVAEVHGEERPRDIAFCRRNFRQVRLLRRLSDVIERTSDARTFTFTCRQYDVETGRCRAWKRRPAVCRAYFCGSESPPGPCSRHGQVQSRIMRRNGIRTKKKGAPSCTHTHIVLSRQPHENPVCYS